MTLSQPCIRCLFLDSGLQIFTCSAIMGLNSVNTPSMPVGQMLGLVSRRHWRATGEEEASPSGFHVLTSLGSHRRQGSFRYCRGANTQQLPRPPPLLDGFRVASCWPSAFQRNHLQEGALSGPWEISNKSH